MRSKVAPQDVVGKLSLQSRRTMAFWKSDQLIVVSRVMKIKIMKRHDVTDSSITVCSRYIARTK